MMDLGKKSAMEATGNDDNFYATSSTTETALRNTGGGYKNETTSKSENSALPSVKKNAANASKINEHDHGKAERDDELAEDAYINPNGLREEELNMLLYEWEPEARSVKEYLDWTVIKRLRNGEHDDDDYEEDEEEKEENGDENKAANKDHAPKHAAGGLKNTKHFDDGSKTEVELKKGKISYLNLTEESAHVVEFYAPW